MKIKFIANIKGVYLGYSFDQSDTVTIGREIGNTIAPINVDGFSRRHARIFFKDGSWYVEDLGSTNGTYRNRVKIEAPTKIEKGDSIRCGLMEIASFDFLDGEPGATIPAEASAQPAEAPKPAEQKPEPVAALDPVAPLEPVAELEPVSPVEPVAPVKTVSVPTPSGGAALRRPTIPSLKPGLKLPPKPGALGAGLKLPPKPGALGAGLKLPPKPGIKPGIKLPPKVPVNPA